MLRCWRYDALLAADMPYAIHAMLSMRAYAILMLLICLLLRGAAPRDADTLCTPLLRADGHFTPPATITPIRHLIPLLRCRCHAIPYVCHAITIITPAMPLLCRQPYNTPPFTPPLRHTPLICRHACCRHYATLPRLRRQPSPLSDHRLPRSPSPPFFHFSSPIDFPPIALLLIFISSLVSLIVAATPSPCSLRRHYVTLRFDADTLFAATLRYYDAYDATLTPDTTLTLLMLRQLCHAMIFCRRCFRAIDMPLLPPYFRFMQRRSPRHCRRYADAALSRAYVAMLYMLP